MTHCNLEGPRASTLLCVKWGCQHLPLRARIHSRKLSIKLKLTLLYAENKPLLFHCTMATVFPGSRACDILFHPPIPPTFLPPVRLRPKLLSLEVTLPGLPGHGPFSWRVRGNRVASRNSAAALRDKLQLHLNCYTGQMMLSFS